jgi:predicted acyltransferase
MSLDVFRGLDIAFMLFVLAGNNFVYPLWFQHAEWNGLTIVDLIFPTFIFIVGTSLSYAKKTGTLHVVVRAVVLFLLGFILNFLFHPDLSSARVYGVLQRIALCYIAAYLITRIFKSMKAQTVTTLIMLFSYWLVLMLPGFTLTENGNLVGYIDNVLLPGHLWTPNFDPEGSLSTLPAIATTLLGFLAGRTLQVSWRRKTLKLLAVGGTCVLAGYAWSFLFPFNKNLWTSSFVLFTAGVAFVLFGGLHWLLDVKRKVAWSVPFQAFGLNALAIYFAFSVVNIELMRTGMLPVLRQPFISAFGSLVGDASFAFLTVLAWLGVALVLFWRRIRIKI